MDVKAAVCAVLALFLLSATLTDALSLGRVGSELRCQCINTYSDVIHPTSIQDVKVNQSGPHCKEVEIIATLKDGTEVCLDPTANWVKHIIEVASKAEDNAE